ncbi:YciI family protein [Glutamicibacter nicotianae]|uniref:YciI family protein n=1 Tax=Glutamicibacter nicotianae TaxID=37929 RepID=UPI002556648B|nr:YciI family protein [Glutamicibacter nicotianae]WIV44983.1 YciI family protein [Glutamicibacter nicotianae]
MTVFAVEYAYAENSTELRDEHRPAHREYLEGFLGEGSVRLLASGPTPVSDGALLIFAAESQVALEDVLSNDPFQLVGAVGSATITEWNPVMGLLKEFAS